MSTTTEYTTSDLALAAFLVMRGLPLLSANRIQGRFEFIFDDKNSRNLISMVLRRYWIDFNSFGCFGKLLSHIF